VTTALHMAEHSASGVTTALHMAEHSASGVTQEVERLKDENKLALTTRQKLEEDIKSMAVDLDVMKQQSHDINSGVPSRVCMRCITACTELSGQCKMGGTQCISAM
jgi:uncharacterized protein YoxC